MNAAAKPSGDESKNADAIALLMADHSLVKGLFFQFAKLKNLESAKDEKLILVLKICTALTVLSMIEEEIFYPAVRSVVDDAELMDKALHEHAMASELIAQLVDMRPDDALFNLKVTALGQRIEDHVREEEGDMFVQARLAGLDLHQLGEDMALRKMALSAGSEIDKKARASHRKTAQGSRIDAAQPQQRQL
jgi:hypothetical protein